jgi:hypothetical protein
LVASVHAVARRATQAQLGSLDVAAATRPSTHGPWVNDVVFAGLDALVRARRFIVSGDWNTARLFDSVYPGTAGTEFFDRARERGWFECVRKIHEAEVQTWFRTGNRPYQLDHAFCDSALGDQLQGVRIATDGPLELGLSDHAALILDFDVSSISITNLTEGPSDSSTRSVDDALGDDSGAGDQ